MLQLAFFRKTTNDKGHQKKQWEEIGNEKTAEQSQIYFYVFY